MDSAPAPTPLTVADLSTGDCLLQLGDVFYPQVLDPDHPPVVIAATRPPEEQVGDLIEIVTSAGRCYAPPATPAMVRRGYEVTETSILLISRRAALHAALCEQGFPVQRRTPVTFDNTANPVLAPEWDTAALVVIDGYLLGESILALWQRGDLSPRAGIVLLCTDPDDARTDTLAVLARSTATVVLPYDAERLFSIFRAAHGDADARAMHHDLFPTG